MYTTGMIFVGPDDPIKVHRKDRSVWLALGPPGGTSLDVSLTADLCVRIVSALVAAMDEHADILGIPEVQS
jgi:hypothetical protein